MPFRTPRNRLRRCWVFLLCAASLIALAQPLAAASNKLAFPSLPGVLYAPGNLGAVTVAVENSSGSVITSGASSTAPVTLVVTGPGGFNQSVTAAAINGLATLEFSNWPLTATGTYTLSASTTASGINGVSASVSRITGSLTLPATAVGSSAAAQTFTFGFTASTQVSRVAVLYKGATGLDFTQSGSSNCVGTQSAGGTCTVAVVFSPQAIGLRLGAVQLAGASGVLQTLAISGVGQGAGIGFSSSGQTPIGTMTGYPDALAFDAQGNLLVADYPSSGSGRVVKIPLVNGAYNTAGQTTVGSGLQYVDGIAVDGAGNVYISDYDENKVIELPAGGGANITLLSGVGAVFNPAGLAVDGAGDLFICDYGNGRLIELPFQNGHLNTAAPIYFTAGFENPSGVKVDPDGNVFIADWGNATVQEIPFQAGALNVAAQKVLVSDLAGQPSNLALDAAGNLYVTLETADVVKVIPRQGGTYDGSNSYILAAGLNGPDAIQVDVNGNVIFCDTYNGKVYLLNNTQPPSLSFASTGIGQTSAAQDVPVLSLGNLPLSISSITFATNFPNQGSSCTGSLQPGYRCDFSAAFAPAVLGTINQSASITDNAVNQSSSTQTVAMSGVGVPGPQAITFNPPASVTYGAATLTLTATGGGSGNPVTFSLVSGPATLSGSQLTVTGVGTVVVAADQAGNAQYTAAPTAPRSITVTPAVLTVTAADATMAYGATPPSFTYALSGWVRGDTATAVTGTPALTTTATSSSAAGAYPITAAFGTLAAANYNFVFINGTLTVTAAAPAVTWNPDSTGLVYGQGLSSGVFNGTSPAGGSWAYSYNGTPVTGTSVLPAGTDTLKAVFTPYDHNDYTPVTLTRDIVIAKAVLTVTAANATGTYGTTPVLTAYTITGFSHGESNSVITGNPVLSTSATSSSSAGTYPIVVSTTGMSAANYSFTGVSGTLTITPAVAPVTWNPTTPATFTYGTSLAGFVHASSPVAGTFTFHLNGALISGAEIMPVGQWEVEAIFTPQDPHNYTAPFLVKEITVEPAPLLFTAADTAATPGSPLPPLTYSVTGFVAGQTASILSGTPVVSTAATPASPSGTYPITVSLAGVSAHGGNYTLIPVPGVLTMTRLSSSVSWTPASGSLAYGSSLASVLTATASTGGALTYTINGTPVTGATVLDAGGYTITATLPPDATHTASSASFALTVTPIPLRVSVANATRAYGAANPSFSGTISGAVAGDGITAAYTTTAGPATPAGAYPITATLAPANRLGNYTITNTPGTLTVTVAPTSVTWTPSAGSLTYGANLAGILNATASTGAPLGYTINGAGVSAATVLPPGSYSILATLAADANHLASSATYALRVNPAPLQVTVASATRFVGSANPVFTGVVAGAVNGDTITAAYSSPATISSPPGTYPINASLSPAATLANYSVSIQPGVLTVVEPVQIITFPAIPSQVFSGSPITVTLSALASSGLPVSYAATGPATVNGSTLTITSAGTVTVTATQAGGNGYPAATPVTQTVTVNAGLGFGLYATGATCGSLTISGSTVVDSYDSSQGAFPAGQLQSGGNVGTNGNLTMNGSTTVSGALYDPHGNTQGDCGATVTSLTTNGTSSVAGGMVALSQALSYPTPAAPSPAPPTTNQVIDYSCNNLAGCSELGGSHHALAPGQYGNLSIGGGAQVDLSAGTYNLNSLSVGGGATFNVVSGPVVFNLAGSGLTGNVLVISGSRPVANAVPANLTFLYAGGVNIRIDGGASLAAVLDAPNAPVSVAGGSIWSGAIVAKTLAISGGVVIHYDRALANQAAASGGSAPVALSPAALDFGSVPVDSASSPLGLTVTNTTATTLVISNVSVSPGFTLTGNCSTVAPGASCSFGVSFSPTAPGTTSGVITLTDNSGGGSQSASLTGVGTAAGASLSPTALTFATASVGTASFSQLVSLTNTGTLTLTNIAVPTAAGDFAVANAGTGSCGASLAAGASCSFSVTFTPSSAGAQTAALGIADSLGTQVVTLAGTGAIPGIALSGTQLGFGSQTIGIASSAQTITVTNTSPVPVTIGSITPTPMFVENDNCVGTLAAGSSCGINVSFSPFAAGPVTGSLTLVDNVPSSPQTVSLSGTGVQGLQLTPASFDFGSVQLGTTSAQQTVHVQNTGDTTYTLTQVSTSGDFKISQNACLSALAPGGNCQVFVTYAPSAAGAAQGTLNLADSTGVITGAVVLTGFGSRPGIAAAPSNVSFGSTGVGKTSDAQTVTVTNTGNIALTIQSLVAQGDFQVVDSNCLTAQGAAQTLAPSATCVVSVAMAPTSYGARTGSLVINNDANGQLNVALSGTGQASNVVLSPSQLSFGSQPIPGDGSVTLTGAPQTVTMTNTGNAVLQVTSIAAQGGFVASSNCGTQLAAGSSCIISVTFAPTALGQWTGNLTVTDDAPNATQVVSMTGTGSPNGLVLDPSTFNFGGLHRGRQSYSQSSTLTNNTGQQVLGLSISASGEVVESDDCNGSLANGASCTITVSVWPRTHGRITGTISVAGTLGGNSGSQFHSAALNATLRRVSAPPATDLAAQGSANLAQIAIVAYGNSNGLSVTPSRLSFADQNVGPTSASQAVTITNADPKAALTGFTLTSNAEFPVTATTCGATLPAGASCQAEIAFRPALAGSRSAILSIIADGGSQATVALEGNASGGTVAITPGSLTFAPTAQDGQSAPQTLQVQNTGSASLVLQSLAVSNPAFTVSGGSCGRLPLTLAANASCELAVVYRPDNAARAAGALTLTSTASNATVTAALTGSTLAPLLIAPNQLDFGPQGRGLTSVAKTVTLTNAGTSAVAISSIAAGDGFRTTQNCGAALAPGTSCQVQVRLAPDAVKSYAATLAIVDAAATQSVPLTGSGTDFSLALGSAPTMMINAGGSAAFSVALTPGQFNGTVALACAGAPVNSSCAVTPASVNLVAGGAAIAAQVSLTTRSRSQLPPPPPSRPNPRLLFLAGALLGLGLLLGGSRAGWRRLVPATRLRRSLLGALLGAALAAAACGGVSNFGTAGGGTPPGTYPLTITATAGSNVHTTTVTVAIN